MAEGVPIDRIPTKAANNTDLKDESTANTQPDPIPASTAVNKTSETDAESKPANTLTASLSIKALFYHENTLISGKLSVDQHNLLFESTPGSDTHKNHLAINMLKVLIIVAFVRVKVI